MELTVCLFPPLLSFSFPHPNSLQPCFLSDEELSIAHQKAFVDRDEYRHNSVGNKHDLFQSGVDACIPKRKPFQKADQVERSWNSQIANSPDEDLENIRAMLHEPYDYSEKQHRFCLGRLPIR